MTLNPLETKAALLAAGVCRLAEGSRLPFFPTRGSSGPLAGRRAVFLEVRGRLVKLGLTKDPRCGLMLARVRDTWTLGGGPLDDAVEVMPVKARFHAPGMAFFHLGEGCVYDCAFCSAPLETGGPRRTPGDWVRLVGEALDDDPEAGVAFTSSIERGQTEAEAIEYMAQVVEGVRARFSDASIGVEPYVTTVEGVGRLREAGADEMKINVETAEDDTFARLCPGLDREGLWTAIGEAVKLFGEGRVCSNVLVGVGETRGQILGVVDRLASMGCVATLRLLRVNDDNRERLERALGGPLDTWDGPSLVALAEEHGKVLERHGLSTAGFDTMCHRCTACDLVPGSDF